MTVDRIHQEGTSEWRNEELQMFFNKVLVAFLKTLALVLFIGMHRLIEWLLNFAFTSEYRQLQVLVQAGTTIGFGFVYICQIWDMIGLFFPRFVFLRKSKEVGSGIDKEAN